MAGTRKIAAILVADIVGYSRLAGTDEDRTLARLRGLRSHLIDPAIDAHHGRIVKRTGDGILIEFRSVVDAVRCAIEVQNGMVERNAGLPPERRIEFRIGIHLGDVVEEADGDLMGDGVNIAARLEGIAAPGSICLSEDAYRQVSGKLETEVTDLGPTQLKNIERPIRVFSVQVGVPAQPKLAMDAKPPEPKRSSRFALLGAGAARDRRRLVFPRGEPCQVARHGRSSLRCGAALRQSVRRSGAGLFRRRRHRKPHHRSLPPSRLLRNRAQYCLHLQGQECRRPRNRQGAWRPLRARRLCPTRRGPHAGKCPTYGCGDRQSPLG